jgi:hypothetical protein
VLLTAAALAVAFRALSPQGDSLLGRTRRLFGGGTSAMSAASASVDPDQDRALFGRNACEQTRARVARGATIGPSDVEGWQVELVLLGRGPHGAWAQSPELAKFVRPQPDAGLGTWVWPNARSLVQADRFDARVEVRALVSVGEAQLSGLRLVFTGPYVVPYFTEGERGDYHLLADALADSLGATDGALFARCAHGGPPAIGSWFLGPDPGAAVGSLLYFMTDAGELPLFKPEVSGSATDPSRHDHAFDAISRAVRPLDRGAVASLIGRELGMISGRPKQPSRLTFPFRDANRASRASLSAARSLKLANAG